MRPSRTATAASCCCCGIGASVTHVSAWGAASAAPRPSLGGSANHAPPRPSTSASTPIPRAAWRLLPRHRLSRVLTPCAATMVGSPSRPPFGPSHAPPAGSLPQRPAAARPGCARRPSLSRGGPRAEPSARADAGGPRCPWPDPALGLDRGATLSLTPVRPAARIRHLYPARLAGQAPPAAESRSCGDRNRSPTTVSRAGLVPRHPMAVGGGRRASRRRGSNRAPPTVPAAERGPFVRRRQDHADLSRSNEQRRHDTPQLTWAARGSSPAPARALDVVNPATAQPLARVVLATPAEVDRAVRLAQAAFPPGARRRRSSGRATCSA